MSTGNLGVPRSRRASSYDPTRPPLMESPSFRIQRWIGNQDSSSYPYHPSAAMPIPKHPVPSAKKKPKSKPRSHAHLPRDSDDAHARRQHAEVDWELEEFEREMALRFVMRDLQLGLEDRRGRMAGSAAAAAMSSARPHLDAQRTRNAAPRAEPEHRPRPRPRQSSTTTLQPLTSLTHQRPSKHPHHTLSPQPYSFPPNTQQAHRLTRVVSSPTPTSTPETPDTASLPSRGLPNSPPNSPSASTASADPFVRLLRSSTRHRASPSIHSISSHFTCTSSASTSAGTDPETYAAGPNASTRSVVSQFGKKIKQGFLPPPPVPPAPQLRPSAPPPQSSSAASPASPVDPQPQPQPRPPRLPAHTPYPYRPKSGGPPVVVDIPPPGGFKKRRVSVPMSLGPKKRRLVVRGIRMDDEFAVDGVRRWASGLGEVSRMCRTQDGTIWIEFRDKRVAESVCCLQAQVQIPRVGRVVLDWAEGRQPG